MPLFHRNVTARSLFGSVLTQRLTAQATPIAAAQIASGVPPDQAATNAANAVVNATPPAADIDEQVRLLSRDKMGQFVVDAETKTAATGGGIPWWLLPIAGAAAVATRFL